MAGMTVEEINMAKSMDSQERDEMVEELKQFLTQCEGYLNELAEKTICKLEQMNEADFLALMEYPAEINEKEDADYGRNHI